MARKKRKCLSNLHMREGPLISVKQVHTYTTSVCTGARHQEGEKRKTSPTARRGKKKKKRKRKKGPIRTSRINSHPPNLASHMHSRFELQKRKEKETPWPRIEAKQDLIGGVRKKPEVGAVPKFRVEWPRRVALGTANRDNRPQFCRRGHGHGCTCTASASNRITANFGSKHPISVNEK